MKFFEPIECQTYMKNMKNSHFLKSCVKNKMINLASKKPLKHSLKRLESKCSGKNQKKVHLKSIYQFLAFLNIKVWSKMSKNRSYLKSP